MEKTKTGGHTGNFFLDFIVRFRAYLRSMIPLFLKQFFPNSEVRGSKSTALDPLLKTMTRVISAMVVVGGTEKWLKLSTWMMPVLVVTFALLLITLLGSYIFLLYKNPDALQTESFMLGKMAIERGDSTQEEIQQDQENARKPLVAGIRDGEDDEA